jgi:hypothetical protein
LLCAEQNVKIPRELTGQDAPEVTKLKSIKIMRALFWPLCFLWLYSLLREHQICDLSVKLSGNSTRICLVIFCDSPITCKPRCVCIAIMMSSYDRTYSSSAREERERHFWKSSLLIKSRKQADFQELILTSINFLSLNTQY